MRVVIVLVLAAAGCNSILGIGDVHLSPDGPRDGADAAVDAPPGTLTGTSVVTYVKADGTTAMKNEDLTGYTIGAYVPDGSPAGYHHVAGTGTADGTFTVPDVPGGETLLELTRPNDVAPQLYAVRARSIDAGWVTLGGPDGVSTTLATPINLNVTGMSAWVDGDSLWADSYATGTENAVYYQGPNKTWTNPPTIGATSLTGSFDWKSGYTYDQSGAPPRLVHASAGDDLYLEHVAIQGVNDQQGDTVALSRLVDLYQGSGVEMTDGATTAIGGTFTKVTLDQTQQLTVDLAQYRALAGDNGHFMNESYNCYRLTNYAVAYDGVIGPAVWAVSGALVATTTGVTMSGSYGDPFPASWGSLFDCNYQHLRAYALPGGENVFWASWEAFDVPATSDMFASPTLGAPTNAVIDGKPFLAGGAIPFDGTGPVTVGWDAVPGAAYYVVTVIDDFVNGTRGAGRLAATISTPDTLVAIPATLLQKGEFYTLRLAAWYSTDGNAFAQGHLRRFGLPSGSSNVVSGLYLFSSDCGNSHVDPGEQCDSGGESATCDADCTLVTCGDGYDNTAAGEVCDNDGDSETCDHDCTPPKCGDGLWNSSAGEACDDGNTTAGDGCSATCQVESGWTCDPSSPSVCTMTTPRLRSQSAQRFTSPAPARARR